jgi:hypothetical protein
MLESAMLVYSEETFISVLMDSAELDIRNKPNRRVHVSVSETRSPDEDTLNESKMAVVAAVGP